MGNIKNSESVNIPPEEYERTRALLEDADIVYRLVEFIFAGTDNRLPPS